MIQTPKLLMELTTLSNLQEQEKATNHQSSPRHTSFTVNNHNILNVLLQP